MHEFYQHFKPLVEKKVDEYLREVREENMQRKPGDDFNERQPRARQTGKCDRLPVHCS